MQKLKLISLLCLTLITTAACSNNDNSTAKESTSNNKARLAKVEKEQTKKSSEPVIDGSAIELKATTPIFNELILEFLQNDLTVEYDGKIGAFEYNDDNKNVEFIGEMGEQIAFNPTQGCLISILKFEDDAKFNSYIESLSGENDEPKLISSSQYSYNNNYKMTMQLSKEIEPDIFNKYKTIFEGK